MSLAFIQGYLRGCLEVSCLSHRVNASVILAGLSPSPLQELSHFTFYQQSCEDCCM